VGEFNSTFRGAVTMSTPDMKKSEKGFGAGANFTESATDSRSEGKVKGNFG
jgi:hypothetical protein